MWRPARVAAMRAGGHTKMMIVTIEAKGDGVSSW
jgi:hypothetical protein